MIDENKLRGKLAENKVTLNMLAEKLGINVSTLHRRINNYGSTFTVKEINIIRDTLHLTDEDVIHIFLPKQSQIETV